MNRYDAIVLGLGVMGSAAAANLAGRGARLLGVEQFQPVHDRGSSHGDSRIVRMAYFEDAAYVPLLRRAYEGWAGLERWGGRQLITWTGALMIGRPESAVVAGTLASAAAWELPHELLDATAMTKRFDQFQLGTDEVAVYERQAGAVDPEAALRAFHEQARSLGADLRFGSPVDGWEATEDGVALRFGQEVAVARHLVVTAGPWTAKLLGPDLSLSPERTVTYHVEPVDRREAFTPDRFPVFVWDLSARDAIYGVGDVGSGAPKVGFHHRGRPTDPDRVNRDVAADEIAAIRAVLAERIPALQGRCIAKTCMYTMTPDEHFVIGHLPATDGRVSVAAGCSGHGFKFSPVIGEILADLALDGGTDLPIALFDPARFAAA